MIYFYTIRQEYEDIKLSTYHLPKLDIKFHLLADILTMQLEALYLEDHQEFLAHLRSVKFPKAASQGYIKVIDSCYKYAKDTEAHQLSYEARAYCPLAIEFLLLQLHFVSLEIRASTAISINSKTERLYEQRDRIFSTCHLLLQRYSVCESYKVAVDGAHTRFINGQAIPFEVWKAIAQVMQKENF